MSEPVNDPAPPEQELEGLPGVPIKFKPRLYEPARPDKGTAPTSRADCEAAGGHGGPNGKRVYYRHGPKLGPLLGDPLVCEICGEVDI